MTGPPAEGRRRVLASGAVPPVPGAPVPDLVAAPGDVAAPLGRLVPAPSAVGRTESAGRGSDSVLAGLFQAGPLAVAGLAANGASVIVTIAVARLLTTRGYGSLNQLTGLFLVLSMPGSAVTVAVVRRVAAWTGKASAPVVRGWGARLHRRGTLAVAAFGFGALFAGPEIAGVLGQPSAIGVDAIMIAGPVWVLLSLDRGLLQARRGYRTLATNFLVEGGTRLAAILVLVGAGFGVPGAAAGLLVAELVTAVHARVAADRTWTAGGGAGPVTIVAAPASAGRPDGRADTGRRALVADLATALVTLATVALLQNIDVIVMGREAPGTSGSYAAVSVASKALVFGPVALGGYLLPEAALRWREGGHALRQLAVTLLILAVPTGVLLGLAVGAPHLLLSVVFSDRYLSAVAAFVPLVLAMACLSTSVVLTMYLLAIGERWIAPVMVAGAAAATVAVAMAHGAPGRTATADLMVQALLVVVLALGFGLVHHRHPRPTAQVREPIRR